MITDNIRNKLSSINDDTKQRLSESGRKNIQRQKKADCIFSGYKHHLKKVRIEKNT
jgi:hypothetical protein